MNTRLTSRVARRLTLAAIAVTLIPASAHAVAVDPWNRDSVKEAYTVAVADGERIDPGWTGSTAACTVGSESSASQNAAVEAVNYVRGMNALPPVVLDADMSRTALAAALIMSANGSLSHYPPPSWRCWNQLGADGAMSSNLFLGPRTSVSAVIGYIADPGSNNVAVGHRRWVLYPPLGAIGTGSTSNTNALTVLGGTPQDRVTPLTVSWPPSGHVPWPLIFDRFSMSSAAYPDADYSHAQVTVTANGTPLRLTVNPVQNGYGDNTIVAEVTIPGSLRTSAAETTFVMTVANVVDPATGASMTLRSQTQAFDFAVPELTRMTSVGTRGQVRWTTVEHGSPITGFTLSYTPPRGRGAPQTYNLPPSARSFTPPRLALNNVPYTVRLVARSRLGETDSTTYLVTRPPQITLGIPRIAVVKKARAVQITLNTPAAVSATVYRRNPRLGRYVPYRVLKARTLATGKRRVMMGVLPKGTYRVVTTAKRRDWTTAKTTTGFTVR